jgi:alpha-amylase
MHANLDYTQPSVREDILAWSNWLFSTLPGLTGLRLDAIKHYSSSFQSQLITHLLTTLPTPPFIFGEYWSPSSSVLSRVIANFKGRISLLDVQLVYNLSQTSSLPPSHPLADLRNIFSNTLTTLHPQRSITFVSNHDTQPHQSLAAPIDPWFVAPAYALILLRAEGHPCVSWGDAYGTNGPSPRRPAAGGRIPRLIFARRHYAYGKQKSYFDDATCIGWTRAGHSSHSNGAGCAVVVNSSWDARVKRMYVGLHHAGEKWTDIMGWAWGDVEIDESGEGVFPVGPRGVGVWTDSKAKGRGVVDVGKLDVNLEGAVDGKVEG